MDAIDIRSGDFSLINLPDWGMSNCLKKYCHSKLPLFTTYKYDDKTETDAGNDKNINVSELGKSCLCVPLQSDHIATIQYIAQLGAYTIFDRDQIFIDKIVISENDCLIFAQAYKGVCYIFDIYTYKGKNIKDLPYIQRYDYLFKLIISGMATELIKIVPINQIVDYINYYAILKTTKYILFHYVMENKNKMSMYKIRLSDIRIPKNETIIKFLVRPNKYKKFAIDLFIVDKFGKYQKYTKIFSEQYSKLLHTDSDVIMCQNKGGKWIPISISNEPKENIKTIIF